MNPTEASERLDGIVAAAASGNSAAWEVLVRRFDRLLHGIAFGQRLSYHDAEDVAQTTWLRLVEHIQSLRTPAAVAGWLSITARRECIRVGMAGAREVPVEAEPVEEETTPTPDERLIEEERRAAVREAMRKLPARQRRLLDLLASEAPPSYDEISAALDMPVGSIGPTRARGLERVRRSEEVERLAA